MEEQSSTSSDCMALYCPTEYTEYGIAMRYVPNEKVSLNVLNELIHNGYIYPGSYIAIDLEGKLATPDSSEVPEIYSLQLGIPVPNSQHSAIVIYWDLQTMPKSMRHTCMRHIQALLDVPEVTTLIHAGKNDVYALRHEYHYELSEPVVNTQVVYFEWMRLIQSVLELYPQCIDPPKLPTSLIPLSNFKEWKADGLASRNIGLNEVYQACGFPENPFKNQSSRSDLKQIYYALNDVAFLCQSYVHIMRAWGELKLYHLKLLTHQKLIATPTICHPPIPKHYHCILWHLSKVLSKRGPMRIPELACHILTHADVKTKQDFSAMNGGVRWLIQQYPHYFKFVASTFDDVKLKNVKVQLVNMVPEINAEGYEDSIENGDPWKTSEKLKKFIEIAKEMDI